MSIQPVESFPPTRSAEAADANAGSGHAEARPESDTVEEASRSISGTMSKQENTVVQKVPSTDELPQGVVEVHQDPEVKDQIIIQYLDQAKNVVLQVRSNQELSVERGIAQESQQAAKLRGSRKRRRKNSWELALTSRVY